MCDSQAPNWQLPPHNALTDVDMKQLFCFDPEGNGIELGQYEDTWCATSLNSGRHAACACSNIDQRIFILHTHRPAVELLPSPLNACMPLLSKNPACLQALPAGAWRGERLAVRTAAADGWL